MIDSLVIILNNGFFQAYRSVGYAMWALSFWAITIAAYSHKWRFKHLYLSIASHMTIVVMWSSLLSMGINISGKEFNALLTVTTSMAILGAIHGARNRGII